MLERLTEVIQTVAPIHGVSGSQVQGIRIDFKDEATQQQRDNAATVLASFDWSVETHIMWLLLKDRNLASTIFDVDTSSIAKAIRAFALITLDEVNALRNMWTAFKAEVDAAASLADLKARVASLPNLPERTSQQLRTAIQNRITAGDAD